MRLLLLVLALVQFGQRPPLSPAETLLEPAVLRAINEAPTGAAAVAVIQGSDSAAGEVVLSCRPGQCDIASQAAQKLQSLVSAAKLAQPSRTIRIVSAIDSNTFPRAKAALHIAQGEPRGLQIVRSPWSTAGIADEVVEIFSRQGSYSVDVRPYENVGQLGWDTYGVPTTTIVTSTALSNQHAAAVAAASAYFLATLPNTGAEPLLSHLMVGAHARLAEDGRKAVAQMGSQQRAGADVLIMFTHAIEREQRRMRSFERFMPMPVDPMLRSRLADMEKGITSVWTSMGITSSPFVPAAERIRGRGGEDRRVPLRLRDGPLPSPDPPTAMLKYPNVADVIYELGNFIDGKRSISDIRDAVSAEFGPVALPVVVDYFERLAKAGAVSIR